MSVLTAFIVLVLSIVPAAAAQTRDASTDQARHIVPAGPRPVKNWPVILDNAIRYAPAVADIDGDGRDEIAVGVRDCRVFLLDSDGRTLPGWPTETAAWIARGPMLEDIDGDGEYEIAAVSLDGFIHMWHEDGSIVSGWPLDLKDIPISAPILVRPASSNDASILVAIEPGVFHLLSPQGVSRKGWPKTLPHNSYARLFDRHSTLVVDLTGTGRRRYFISHRGRHFSTPGIWTERIIRDFPSRWEIVAASVLRSTKGLIPGTSRARPETRCSFTT